MNDAEIMNRWLQGTDWQALVAAIEAEPSDRKLRLYAAACCRAVWSMLPDVRSRAAVQAAEEFADAKIDHDALQTAFRAVRYSVGKHDTPRLRAQSFAQQAARSTADLSSHQAATYAAQHSADAASWSQWGDAERDGATDEQFCRFRQAALLEQIASQTARFEEICPPATPGKSSPSRSWITPALLEMAQGIYDQRSFRLLPVLADALEEAGCPDGELVAHLRRPAEHVRGCWALDIILGKQ